MPKTPDHNAASEDNGNWPGETPIPSDELSGRGMKRIQVWIEDPKAKKKKKKTDPAPETESPKPRQLNVWCPSDDTARDAVKGLVEQLRSNGLSVDLISVLAEADTRSLDQKLLNCQRLLRKGGLRGFLLKLIL